jgi:DNA-binding MarR family transcriptional regulator
MAHALSDLAEADGLSQTDLAARLRLEKSTVSRLVAELRQRGWLERQRDQKDGRIARLSLTDAGRAQAERLHTARTAMFGQLADRLSDADRDTIEHALDLLVRALHPAASHTIEEHYHADQNADAR